MIAALSLFFCTLPLSWAMAVGKALGWVWYYLLPIRRRVALDNVERALGDSTTHSERRRIVRRCFQHLTMMAVESLRMPTLTEELSKELVRREHFDPFLDALGRGKGMIVVLAHLGNFEMLAATSGMRGLSVNAVVKDLKMKSVNRFVSEVRRRTNYKTVPPRRSKDQIRALLAQGETVCVLVDQHMGRHRSVVCEFFGQLASTSPAPARFAFETGAPIFLCAMFREKKAGHHVARMEPEFHLETPSDDLQENIWHNTQRINRVIEGWIRERPDMWLWVHKRWKVHDNPEGWEIPPALAHLCQDGPAHLENTPSRQMG